MTALTASVPSVARSRTASASAYCASKSGSHSHARIVNFSMAPAPSPATIPNSPIRTANKPRVFVFGYGSLINLNSLRRSLCPLAGAASSVGYESTPVVIDGFRRQWSYHCNQRSYTAVSIHDDPSSKVNGVLVEVRECDLPVLDQRERDYTRTVVPHHRITTGVYGGKALSLDSAVVYAYVLGPPSHRACRNVPVPQSYIDCIISGALQISSTFASDFVRLTQGWNDAHWVNDRVAEAPIRRYVCDPKSGEIDPSNDVIEQVDIILETFVPSAFNARVNVA
ncbi:hypothetical protein HDU82_008112 [Entophlyctis luteolus]|nr:hypothetical protein HDU82_008112 [Entophlyctis luteolus]